MRLFEQQGILGKEACILNSREIQVAAAEEITRVKSWDSDGGQRNSPPFPVRIKDPALVHRVTQ